MDGSRPRRTEDGAVFIVHVMVDCRERELEVYLVVRTHMTALSKALLDKTMTIPGRFYSDEPEPCTSAPHAALHREGHACSEKIIDPPPNLNRIYLGKGEYYHMIP